MDDLDIRTEGRAGRITLCRPQTLNALTHPMALAIEKALVAWADEPGIALVIIDAQGERAFCAGGDIQEMYERARAGDHEFGRAFWRDEYRLNARIFEFPKPFAAFMQGFTMGGGVGLGCHGSHRVVTQSSRIAMPECGIGLVPDVGGSLLLARAPGRLGEYLGTTGTRMEPGDAIDAGFADYFIPEEYWPGVIAELCETGDPGRIDAAAGPAPQSPLAARRADIDAHFGGETLRDILASLEHGGGEFPRDTLNIVARNSPLSMATTVEMIHRLRGSDDIRRALELEFRFTARAFDQSDFLEGIRAAVIDKDRTPRWRHATPGAVTPAEVSAMLRPLGREGLNLSEELR